MSSVSDMSVQNQHGEFTVGKSDLIIASILFVVLQLLDWMTTSAAIASGVGESNPLMVLVLTRHGMAGLFAVKVALVAVLIPLVWLLDARYNGGLRRFLWAGCGFYLFVLGNNFGQLSARGVL